VRIINKNQEITFSADFQGQEGVGCALYKKSFKNLWEQENPILFEGGEP
jgi:hypothetical protein